MYERMYEIYPPYDYWRGGVAARCEMATLPKMCGWRRVAVPGKTRGVRWPGLGGVRWARVRGCATGRSCADRPWFAPRRLACQGNGPSVMGAGRHGLPFSGVSRSHRAPAWHRCSSGGGREMACQRRSAWRRGRGLAEAGCCRASCASGRYPPPGQRSGASGECSGVSDDVSSAKPADKMMAALPCPGFASYDLLFGW